MVLHCVANAMTRVRFPYPAPNNVPVARMIRQSSAKRLNAGLNPVGHSKHYSLSKMVLRYPYKLESVVRFHQGVPN